MKFISKTTRIDDATYDPIYQITLELTGEQIEEMVTRRDKTESFIRLIGDGKPTGIDWQKEYSQLMGMRLMQILEEQFTTLMV